MGMTATFESWSRARRALCTVLALLFVTGLGWAEPEPMTRDQIIELAKPAVGHGYKWGYGHWTDDGSQKGVCSPNCDTCGCGACTFPGDKVGADCSGYVAKVWQVPEPSPIETNNHPYDTGAFHGRTDNWQRIDRSDLKRGDALVTRNSTKGTGHIVLFDRFEEGSQDYWVYEARGCRQGIVYNKRAFGSEYVAIRRDHLLEEDACQPDTCNERGACSYGACDCDLGFAGDHCERCAAGFVGYPSCTRPDWTCAPQGEIQCEATTLVSPHHASNVMDSYSCGDATYPGGEQVFQFRPQGTGKARVHLRDNAGGATVVALRSACSPEACVGEATDELEFEYGAGEVYYLAVESGSGANSDVQLQVDCDTGDPPWIGDACNEDSDCAFTDPRGQSLAGTCYRTGSSGFCTLPCTRTCPDLPPNKAETYCVADPADPAQGICVSKSERRNQFCELVPGSTPQLAQRFGQPSHTASVCLPDERFDVCEGTLVGSVVRFADGSSVAGADITIAGSSGQTQVTARADGQYTSGVLPCGSYDVTIEAPGFLPEQITGHVTQAATTHLARLRALATDECSAAADVSGVVFDGIAQGAPPLAGARLQLRRGIDTTSGTILATSESALDGSYTFPDLQPGHYTASVSRTGYATSLAHLIACGNDGGASDIALTPAHQNAYRIVLSWERPDDLDLHLQLPNGREVFFRDECQGDLQLPPYAHLDIDRREPTGPETISISRFIAGTYTVFVHNFSQHVRSAEESLQSSAAQVVVFDGDNREVSRFSVPSSGQGYFWDVFKFEGSNPGVLRPIQTLTDNRPNPHRDYANECAP